MSLQIALYETQHQYGVCHPEKSYKIDTLRLNYVPILIL